MKKIKLLMAVLATSILAGCGGGENSNDEVTITLWEDDTNIPVVQELVDEYITNYKTTYPNGVKINVNIQAQQEKSAVEKMITVSETGNGPDIASVTHDTIAKGVAANLIAPASYYEAVASRMTTDAINAVEVKGTSYGYPITAESQVIVYDKTKASASDFVSMEALKDSGKKLAWVMTGDNGAYYTWALYTDSVLFGENGKNDTQVNLNTNKTKANLLEFYTKYTGSIIDSSPEEAVSLVATGTEGVVGLVSSPFILNSMKEALGDNMAVAKLPTLNGEELRPFSGYKAYVVSSYSKHGQIAQDLANHLTTYDAQAYRLFKLGYLPACKLDVYQDIIDLLEMDKNASVFADSLDTSIVMPTTAKIADFWSPMNNIASYFWQEKTALTATNITSKLNEASTAIKNG